MDREFRIKQLTANKQMLNGQQVGLRRLLAGFAKTLASAPNLKS